MLSTQPTANAFWCTRRLALKKDNKFFQMFLEEIETRILSVQNKKKKCGLKYADISISTSVAFLYTAYTDTLKHSKIGSWNSIKNNFTASQSLSISPEQKIRKSW